ncbi:MAG: hypothetical protein KJ955_06600 [Nanoarchaeota archaeon]|nr:hypothetical protein [Nanoarchaeota archaeon]
MAELEDKIIRFRPHNLVKVLWKDLLRTEAEIGMECTEQGYPSQFYSKVCEVRNNLFYNKHGVILVPGFDDMCHACDSREDFICRQPDNGDSNRQFMDDCGLEMNVPYANRDLLERIRGYASMQIGDPMAILKGGFIDLILIGNEKQHGGN